MKCKNIVLALCVISLVLIPGFQLFSQSNSGEVQIYIFSEEGLPLEGVELDVDNTVHRSDESGLLAFVYRPGTYDFTLTYQGAVVAELTIPVRQAQATEVIVTASKKQQQVVQEEESETADDIKGAEGRLAIDESLPTGTLSGTIVHFESRDPVPNATVIFRGVDYETTTDDDGTFTALLPEGTYSVSVIHPDFSTQTMDEIDITVEETTEIAMEMTPSAVDLGEVAVFAATEVRVQGGIANLIEETRNSGVVLNLIGTEQLSRTGDSDAASALTRVTGLTIVDRFIYVRGMGERYSNSYLNGTILPSPMMDKKVVPLDLFPVSVIESMAVQKTFSPDMWADFGGGAIMLRTTGIPKDRYKRRLRANIRASVTYDAGTTFTEQLLENGGSIDFLGIDDGTRKLPTEIDEADLIREGLSGITSGYSAGEIEQFGELLDVNWSPVSRMVFPDFSLSGSLRNKIELNSVSEFAYSLSLMYKNSYDISEKSTIKYVNGADNTLAISQYLDGDSTSHDIDIGALADFAFKINENLGIESTTLLTRITESNVNSLYGYYSDEDQDVTITDQEWVEQMLFSEKLGGNIGLSILNDAEINWKYAFNLANQYLPERRATRYDAEVDSNDFSLSPQADGAILDWAEVSDMIHDASLEINVPVFFTKNSADFLDFGIQGMYRTRSTNSRSFQMFYNEADFTEDFLSAGPDDLFIPEYITNDGGFELRENTLATDNYKGSQILLGGFASGDILLFKKLRVNPGVRVEYSSIMLDTYDLFSGLRVPSVQLNTFNVLPALNLTLPIANKMQARLGGSMTVNRPEFRELSDQPRDPLVGEEQFIGNPNLQEADIYNADLRFEAYLAEEENISIGGFFKYFNNAIELRRMAGAANPVTPDNVQHAYNLGGELEWQLTFRFISDLLRGGIRNLHMKSYEAEQRTRKFLGGMSGFFRDLYTSGNVSFIWSQVDYGDAGQGIYTTAVRPLQGQSPYIINLSLGYQNHVSWSQERPVKMSLFVNYNVYGRRIAKLGVEGLPDYYEEPFHQLDVVLKQRFGYIFSISLKANNLLDLPVRETITVSGEKVTVDEYRKGRSFTLGVSFDL